MRNWIVFILTAFLSLPLSAQKENNVSKDNIYSNGTAFNLGATIGFNTTFPIINSITVDDVELENISLTYKVGHQASVFCRLNMERFFIQPSISWQHTEGDILFTIPQTNMQAVANANTPDQKARLEMSKQTILVPVHIGYHIVREGPYGLTFTAGPTLKYNYNVEYKSSTPASRQEFISESNPFGLNIATGISVQIWQLFFDFIYEFGLNQTESDFKNKEVLSPETGSNLRIDKRVNVMSFSLGIVF